MESNNLANSVQDEQFDKKVNIVETTQETSSAVIENIETPVDENKEQLGLDNSYEIDEFESSVEQVILPEDLAVPDELNDDEDEHSHDLHVSDTSHDYTSLSKEELIKTAETLIKDKSVESIKVDIDNIKIQFYKKHKSEFERLRKLFVDNGGIIEEFVSDPDPLEEKLKEILKNYKELRSEFTRKHDAEKAENLKIKQFIIEEIKILINGNESLNDTFQQFRELQKKWRSTGPVPQTELNNLWESYNHHVEKFYDFIKINNELRDLDLKKNFEIKIDLCEKAEALLLEPSIVRAFKLLQDYHNKWRETGPVPNEMRTDIWNRFKEITGKINKLHQEYFESQKTIQQQNLEAKTLLCEKAEDILNAPLSTMKEWEDKSKELVELQNVWKTIGFAPKKDNTRIYQRFRAACDGFFGKKREFYSEVKEIQNNNLQLKLELCIQAESIKDSTEWKRSTADIINIQKKWKEIGPVPRKVSDTIWKRFRAACDAFFENKSKHFASVDSKYDDNLKNKLLLIEEIENFKLGENVEENFTSLKEFQRRWAEIGFVPIKQKEEIQDKYRKAIDRIFDNLKVDDGKKRIMKFKSRIEQMPHSRKNDVKIDRERDKFIIRLKKLESDIVLLENNIGFFAKSKNAEVLRNEVQTKIDSAKVEMKELEEKIKMIDKLAVE
jgi:hypothetical protein